MAVEPLDVEREWGADKRDFVADRRDDVAAERELLADAREATADERERLADERESALEEWQRRLDALAAQLGPSSAGTWPERHQALDQGGDARNSRRRATRERDEERAARDNAAADRAEAGTRRQAARPDTRLAMVFAEIAQLLFAADNLDDVLPRIAEAAVSTVAGCRMASVTVSEDGAFRTVASTDAAASATDGAQYRANEGPCIDAIDEPVVYAPSFPDARWPVLAARPVDLGVRSAASFRLGGPAVGALGSFGGSLNTYAVTADAFDDEAREIGLILAVHASVAAQAIHDRVALEQLGRNLRHGLSSRDVIGQAKGILMERLKITPEAAFDILRRSSQHVNEKLHIVAQRLAETGEYDDAPGPAERSRRSVPDGEHRTGPTR